MSNVFPLEAGESPTHHSIPGLPQGVIVLQGLPQRGEKSAWTLWEREGRHRHSVASFPVLHSICYLWCKFHAKSTSDKCYKGSGNKTRYYRCSLTVTYHMCSWRGCVTLQSQEDESQVRLHTSFHNLTYLLLWVVL